MSVIELLSKEMDQETATTRKMLSRVPGNKLSWKPHEKSMSLRQLAVHIAELPGWVAMGLNTSELDFAAAPYNPAVVNDTTDLMHFSKHRQQVEKLR